MKTKKEKRSSFWEPNSESFFSNDLIRWLNYILLFVIGYANLIFISAYIEVELEIHSYVMYFPISLIFSLSIALWIIDKRIDHTQFFLWDYTERKKKDRYLFKLFLVSGFLCVISVNVLFLNSYIIWHSLKHDTDYFMGWDRTFVLVVNTLSFLLVLINPFRLVELYYPIFKDELETAYKIQKKPVGWIDAGKEIDNKDEIVEIMERDFGIRY